MTDDRSAFTEARQAGLAKRQERRLAHAQDRENPFESLRSTLALSSNDWGAARDFAWLWGIVLGWANEDGDAYPELAERFAWPPEAIDRLKQLHTAFNNAEQAWKERNS